MKWKTGIAKIIVATNAFGLGINTLDIYLIIHFNFPLSIGQYIQESGRAGRDGSLSKSIILFSRSEFKLLYGIICESRGDVGEDENTQRKVHLEQSLQKLHELMFFCEKKYKCLQQTLLTYYAWSTDTNSSPCDNCGNCQRKFVDNPNLSNVNTDAIRMINIVRKIIEKLGGDNIIVCDDIIGIFLQLKNKKLIDKKLNSVSIYDENFNRTIRNSKQANHLLDELISKKMIIEIVTLQKSGAGFWITNSKIIDVAEGAEELVYSYSWDYYF